MKSLFVAFVLLCLALNVKCGYDLYFEYTCADEYFKPQDGQLHLIANFKDSTVDDFFKRGFNFTKFQKGASFHVYAGLKQYISEISSLLIYWTLTPWAEDPDPFKTPFILLKELKVAPFDRKKNWTPDLSKAKTFCPKQQKIKLKEEVEFHPCD